MTFEEAVTKSLAYIQAHRQDALWDSVIDLEHPWFLDIWTDNGVRSAVLLRRDSLSWHFNLSDQVYQEGERPCEICGAPTTFERCEEGDPPEGEVCSKCDSWVCSNCINYAASGDHGYICILCAEE